MSWSIGTATEADEPAIDIIVPLDEEPEPVVCTGCARPCHLCICD